MEKLTDSKLTDRILASYRVHFGSGEVTQHGTSRQSSPVNKQRLGSPVSSFRLEPSVQVAAPADSRAIALLESRVASVDSRNSALQVELDATKAELDLLRRKLADTTEDRDQLAQQVSKLRSVVSSESSAGKVLERVSTSETSSLELKLGIYKQQILLLNEELDKLRKMTP